MHSNPYSSHVEKIIKWRVEWIRIERRKRDKQIIKKQSKCEWMREGKKIYIVHRPKEKRKARTQKSNN